ncbi:MAG: carbon starvation CstA family protein, partial [Hyphomicrobium sp.]
GAVFIADVHDAGAIWDSIRNRARSMGSLTEDVVGHRARSLFMIVIFLLLLMVNTVFGVAMATLFVSFPSGVFPSWSAIAAALVIGYLIYRRSVGLLWPSLIGVAALYLTTCLGDFIPHELTEGAFGFVTNAQWIIILFVYAAVASLLPVWLLLQPKDYINGLHPFVGLGLFYAAVLVLNPSIVAPAFNTDLPEGTPPMIPLLFVTIACGAISGFHGLVSSGTTSKQLDKEHGNLFPHSAGTSAVAVPNSAVGVSVAACRVRAASPAAIASGVLDVIHIAIKQSILAPLSQWASCGCARFIPLKSALPDLVQAQEKAPQRDRQGPVMWRRTTGDAPGQVSSEQSW